jgi:hypothetical protein
VLKKRWTRKHILNKIIVFEKNKKVAKLDNKLVRFLGRQSIQRHRTVHTKVRKLAVENKGMGK